MPRITQTHIEPPLSLEYDLRYSGMSVATWRREVEEALIAINDSVACEYALTVDCPDYGGQAYLMSPTSDNVLAVCDVSRLPNVLWIMDRYMHLALRKERMTHAE